MLSPNILAKSIVGAIEISEYAPTYYNKRLELIHDVTRLIVAESDDSFNHKEFIHYVTKHLNANRTWLRIGACLKLDEAIEKQLLYHALYHAATNGYVNAKKDEEGWVIEKDSFIAWLRSYPYGAYGGK